MELYFVILLIFLILVSAANIALFFLFFKLKKELQDFKKLTESSLADQAEAFVKLTQLLDKEFNSNFEAHQKMQQANEDIATKLLESDQKIYEAAYHIQSFLNKFAEGLGFRTKSNLEEI